MSDIDEVNGGFDGEAELEVIETPVEEEKTAVEEIVTEIEEAVHNEEDYGDAPVVETATEAPGIEETREQSVVLQESDVDHFSAEPVVDEPAENLLNYQQESEPEPTYEPEREPVRSDITEPIYVTETTVRRLSVSSPNENRNPNGHGNPKKLAGSVWPPRGDEFAKQNNSEEGGPGKKRVSDLIARFNAGNIENDSPSKVDYRYKQEYGAGGNSGKVQQSVFQ